MIAKVDHSADERVWGEEYHRKYQLVSRSNDPFYYCFKRNTKCNKIVTFQIDILHD